MTTTTNAIDRSRVAKILEREEARYRERTPRSAALHARARQALPLGVASTFQAYDPYPLFMTDARGSRIEDADYSSETTALAKAQILSQASTAMISQANQSQQNVLSLLK